jgi:hypothetical protein
VPIFAQSQPSTLRRYFTQLETLFAQCQITSDLERNDFATQFIDSNIADTWEALPEFQKTYTQFRDHLFNIYNQKTLRYTFYDLEQLVSDSAKLDFCVSHDLTHFHLRFNAISTFLLDLGLLSLREQSAMYLQLFSTVLRSQIELRLQIQYPDHSALPLHPINAIFEAAQWVSRYPSNQRSLLTPLIPQNIFRPQHTLLAPKTRHQRSKHNLCAILCSI